MPSNALIEQLVPTLFEDDLILAVAKPAGVDVSGIRGALGLCEILTQLRGSEEQLEPANRLSRHESGVLILGKNPSIVRHIRTGLRSNRINQEYSAVVLGRMSKPQLLIDARHGGSRGKARIAPHKHAQEKGGDHHRAKNSAMDGRTVVKLVRAERNRSLVRCQTTVATTHALRAQLRAVRLRVLGDELGAAGGRTVAPDRTCLHLSRFSFFHPVRKAKLAITSRVPKDFSSVVAGKHDPTRALHAALAKRLPCLMEPDTNVYRMLTGSAEGLPGIVAERFGDVVVLQVHEPYNVTTESLRQIASWYRDMLGIRSVYVKHFVKDRKRASIRLIESLHEQRPFLGSASPPEIAVEERGLRFAIRPFDGYMVGLFPDQRENRSRIRSMVEGRSVLNLFAYTCGFSVAAAAGGAKRVVSVDISAKHLQWGERNFALNDLDVTRNEFVSSNAMDYCRGAARRNKRFDVIVIDPPSFAHGRRRKQSFSIAEDLPKLVSAAVEVLERGGMLLVSTNYRKFTDRDLRERVRSGGDKRRFRVVATPGLPLDYAVDTNHAKTIIARFD